ncbi:hypothetical protein R84B8_00657 [Treponema sp. R8-4-B8]
MKNHKMFKSAAIMTVFIMTLALAASFVISCGDSSNNTEAKLTSITVKGAAVDVPSPISVSLWNDDDFYDTEYTKIVMLNDTSELAGVQVNVVISAGAKAAYGLASGYDKPSAFDSNSTLDISVGQALYIRVTSEDGKTVNYYRFDIQLKNANSQLSTLTVAEVTAELGTPAVTLDEITNIGKLSLSNAKKTDANIVGTPRANTATVEYAFSADGTFAATNNTHTFADGDYLFVKVTAENQVNISYYKIEVQIGRDATLKNVKIGESDADSLGTPRTSWGNGNWGVAGSTQRGTCQADGKMPEEGFTVVIEANDEEATVVWARTPPRGAASTSVIYPEPTAYDGTSPYQFPPDASDLIIKVTSANKGTTNWYQVRFIAKSYGVVYKGTPTIKASSEQYIDPIWNEAAYFTDEGEGDMKGWLDVSRLNTAESYNAWFGFDYGRHTTARAKVLWDDDGLWSYWDIDFKDYKESETGATKVRSASVSGDSSTYTPGTDVTVTGNSVPSDAHTRDSVEFFVNERWQAQKTGNYGNQYRSGLPNADGTVWLSGEKGNAPTTFNPITKFQIDKKVSTWVKKNGDGKEIGYVVIMRVPWVHYGTDDDQVFGADNKVIDGAEIGLELQVNACAIAATRNGILTWNGVTSQAYQNVKSFGIVTLKASKE